MKGRIKLVPERIGIGKGITLNLLPCEKFKTNCIAIRLLTPLSKETAPLNALLPFVLKRGCKRLPTMAKMEEELELLYGSELYGNVGRHGDCQYFGFTSYPLRDRYAEGTRVSDMMLSLMAELLFSPLTENGVLVSDYVESEKRVLADKVRAAVNNKSKYAVKRCVEEMGKGDPSSISELGRVEDIEAVTPKALTDALDYALKHHRIEIWCAGDFDRDSLVSKVTELFSAQDRDPVIAVGVKRLSHADEVRTVTEEQPVKQGKLCLGFTTDIVPSGRTSAIYGVFNEVFSSSPVSKLFVNVREKLSLCYYCHAIPNKKKGTLIVTSGIEVDNFDTAREAIMNELRSIAEGNVSEEELVSAKKSIISSAKGITDDYASIITWYFSQIDEERVMTPEEYADLAIEVTVSDLMNIAASFVPHTVYFLKGTATEDTDED